jgi:sulfoxide reductase heme-binding subunit YedZ
MTLAKRINKLTRSVPAWPIYLFGAAMGGWYFWLALKLLVVVLAITPLREATKVSLVKYRRALGVTAFFLVVYHLCVWAFLDVQTLGRVIADIMKRPYITIGMFALAMLTPLAITSNDWSIRKLGFEAWQRIHYLAYPAILLGSVHFVMLRKGWQLQPLIYLAIIVLLLAWRVKWRRLVPGVLAGSRA